MTLEWVAGAAGVGAASGPVIRAGVLARYDVRPPAATRPAVDYTSLNNLARNGGTLFWRDLELHHPGISSLNLPAEVATAWKLRRQTISHDPRRAGQQRKVPENTLMHVRAFYADLAAWAAEDPVRWGRFAAPSPVRASEITFTKIRRHRKAAMDQRTRTLAPVLPALVRQVRADLDEARQQLHTAARVSDGQEFTAAGGTWRRHDAVTGSGRIYDIGPGGRRLDLAGDEERAFWTRASVQVLRHTGVRIEEMLELTHHSFCAYTLPTTGEVVPMLQAAPSETDSERLLLVSPELGDVFAEVINRVRGTAPALPLTARWNGFERRWSPLMPFLFQRPDGGVHKPVTRRFVASALDRAVAAAGLTGPDGTPLRITPHDFCRIFATDPLRAGLPPHAAAKILASLHARLAEAREQGWGGEVAGLEVSIAAAGPKLAAMDQMAARHQVTHLGMPDFRPSTGRSSGAAGGP